MPYVYTQSKLASMAGLPMTRALLVEYPEDRGAWEIENEYLFGSDILVAPVFEEGAASRSVYLPGGKWIDLQTGLSYSPGWHEITAGPIEAVILVRDGVILPQIKVAQHTGEMDWNNIDLVLYSTGNEARGKLFCPGDESITELKIIKKGKNYVIEPPLNNSIKRNFKIIVNH